MYGDPSRSQSSKIWEDIERYLQVNSMLVCMIGDFNTIALIGEKWGGNSFMSSHNKAFRAWTHSVGMIDLGYHGPAYIWCNNKKGLDTICERLDRAMVNLS